MKYDSQLSLWHKHTDESIRQDMENWEQVMKRHELLPASRDAKILDIGCADGRLLLTLKNMGYNNLFGIEVDEDLANYAKQSFANIYQGDVTQCIDELPDNLDVIYMFDVLEHIPKDKQVSFLRKLKSHLSPAGFLVVQVPNAASPVAEVMLYQDYTHFCSFTDVSLGFVLTNAGFEQISIREQDPPYNRQIALMRSFWNALYQAEFSRDEILSLNVLAVAYATKDESRVMMPKHFPVKEETLSAEKIWEMFSKEHCLEIEMRTKEVEKLKIKVNELKQEVITLRELIDPIASKYDKIKRKLAYNFFGKFVLWIVKKIIS
ncbi:class I SAM-dependent methyltransferase [Selenomonas ruminantium]|uniref:class I SAM-dependent methyltransferase n=1 Tax=Selenomonas ruminantium TaxID=971 RepID=UPI00047BC29D|nr:class I SAM-dependent methyltransferase [Selenomonas ruminantium]